MCWQVQARLVRQVSAASRQGGRAGWQGKAAAREGWTGWEGADHPEKAPTWRPRRNSRAATRAVCQRPPAAAASRHADAKSWQLLETALYGSRANWLAPLSSAASQAAAAGLLRASTCQYLVREGQRHVSETEQTGRWTATHVKLFRVEWS